MLPPLPFDEFVSTREAAKGSGYSADYLSRLARAGHVRGKLIGSSWYVDQSSLAQYLFEQKIKKQERLDALSRSRVVEYQEHQEVLAPVATLPSPSPAPVLSPLSPVLRPAGPIVPALSFVTACAVVVAGVLLGHTPLLPNAGAQMMAVAHTAAGGFVVMAEPLRAHIAARVASSHPRSGNPSKLLAGGIGFLTRQPPFELATFTPSKIAVLTNNQAVKSRMENSKPYPGPSQLAAQHVSARKSLGAAAELVAKVARAYVSGIHALIAAEARLAYAPGPLSSAVSRLAVEAVGEVGVTTSVLADRGARALRAGGIMGGHEALALARGAFGGVGADAGRIAYAPVWSWHSAKKIAQNIVSSASLRTKNLFARTPASAQLAATDAAAGDTAAITQGGVAAPGPQSLPVVISLPVSGKTVSYGDVIAYNVSTEAYVVAEGENATVIGVASERPPVLLSTDKAGVPVVQSGRTLVNVTDENGPIVPGDEISLSQDVPGKAIKASSGATDVIGIARESFTGEGTTTSITVGSKQVAVGTIAVDIAALKGGLGQNAGGARIAGCADDSFWCSLESKVVGASLLTLLRYLLALLVAVGALYIAFRTFLSDAISGVISVGRNPRAKAAIQAMVVFNGVLAVGVAAAGLVAALAILLLQL